VDYVFPKNNRLFIFGSYRGISFRDNAYYFFNYIYSNHKEIQTIIFSLDHKIRKDINEKYGCEIAMNPFSLKGFIYALRAKVAVISYNLFSDIPISFFFSKKKIVVNVWHGIPIKGIQLSDAEWSSKQIEFYLDREAKRYTLFPANSKFTKLIYAGTFGVLYNNIPITGSPRDDCLYNNLHYPSKINKIKTYFKDLTYKVETIILYAPTKRENGVPRFFPFTDINLKELNNYLLKKNILLVLRPHLGNTIIKTYGIADLTEYSKYDAIRILNDYLVNNVNDILTDIDILITDYSGIFYDYLLLNRPIIFIPYDIKDYSLRTGFLLDYNFFTPGPKISSQKELLEKLTEYINDPKIDSEKRTIIRDLFHKYFDGNACNRLYQKITSLI